MTTFLESVQQFLDSDDIAGAREFIETKLSNLRRISNDIREVAALFTLGSQSALEVGLGVLGRKLQKTQSIDDNIAWLLLAAVLSHNDIDADSPSRISILGLISTISNWDSPTFALLAPALDSFFRVSLTTQGSPLVAEQTLDFLATWGDSYATAPRTNEQLLELHNLAQIVANEIDDSELKEEWCEGLNCFLDTGQTNIYADQRIWSAASELLRNIYPTRVLNRDNESNDFNRTRATIVRLITSSLAAVGTILSEDGLSVAVHIDNPEEDNFWALVSGAIDKLERLFQEAADLAFIRVTRLPTFRPAQAVPGSWTVILHINLSENQTISLANAISSLASSGIEGFDPNSPLAESWIDCASRLQKDNLCVDMAVAANIPDLYIAPAISTEDVPSFEEFPHPNIRILSRDVPQANSLERVLDLAALLLEYPSSPSIVREEFLAVDEITPRQFAYYRRAAEILGLLDWRGRPTAACSVLMRLPEESQMRFLAHQFISSSIGAAWLSWEDVHDLAEIRPETAAQFVMAVSPSLSEDTARRRATTLQSWLEIFLEYWYGSEK